MDVFGYVFGLCVWVTCMDTRSSARSGSINIGAYLSLGPVSIIIGTYSLLEAHFYHHWDLLAPRGPFHIILGTYSLHEAHFYHHWDLLASRGPFHHYRVLLAPRGPFHIILGTYSLLKAHFIITGTYSLLEAHLNDSPNFSNFPRQKWKNLPLYAMSNKFF
jgi:hypothetical protein